MMMIAFRIPHQIRKLLQRHQEGNARGVQRLQQVVEAHHVVQRSHLQNRFASCIVEMPQQPVRFAMAAL